MNNVIEHRLPNNPMYALEHKRLATFEDWPPGMPIKPEILAGAGFFYLGKSVKITNSRLNKLHKCTNLQILLNLTNIYRTRRFCPMLPLWYWIKKVGCIRFTLD